MLAVFWSHLTREKGGKNLGFSYPPDPSFITEFYSVPFLHPPGFYTSGTWSKVSWCPSLSIHRKTQEKEVRSSHMAIDGIYVEEDQQP